MKICSKCKEELDYSKFGRLKKSPDGYRQKCKKCRKEDDLLYTESTKEWRKRNKDKKAVSDKKYYENNKEQILEYAKEWRSENKELNSKFMSDWAENNKDHVRNYKREWEKEKRNKNPSYKIHNRFSCLMRNHMVKYLVDGKSGSSWVNFVDYDADDLISHLGINLMKKGYEIDHIIPVSLYDFKEMGDEEFRKCWDINNLRVITKEKNLLKSDKLDMDLIIEHNIEHLLPFTEI